MTEGERLSVATYNIHRGVGRDRRMDHQRIAKVILELDADVIALQEVETPAVTAAGSVALLHRLRQSGYEPVLGPTMHSDGCSYGNALLSRLPVRAHKRHDLSRPGREPRGVIEARLARSGAGRGQAREITCFATHLGLSRQERHWQMSRLAERIERAAERAQGICPTIALGDFNEWRRRSRRLAVLEASLEPAPARPTYPGRWPILALDRIWFGGGLSLESLEVVRTRLAKMASDHLPLRAELRLPSLSR